MKLTALAAVILALGIVLGFALAGGSLGGPASAVPQCPGPSSQCATPTPAPPQQREDQVTIIADPRGVGFPIGTSYTRHTGAELALDASRYPPSADFRLELVWVGNPAVPHCVRLFDVTDNAPLIASEICLSGDPGDSERLRSAPFTLPAGAEHGYVLEAKKDGTDPSGVPELISARIIVEWTE